MATLEGGVKNLMHDRETWNMMSPANEDKLFTVLHFFVPLKTDVNICVKDEKQELENVYAYEKKKLTCDLMSPARKLLCSWSLWTQPAGFLKCFWLKPEICWQSVLIMALMYSSLSQHVVNGCIIMKGAAIAAIPLRLNDGRVVGCSGENSMPRSSLTLPHEFTSITYSHTHLPHTCDGWSWLTSQ